MSRRNEMSGVFYLFTIFSSRCFDVARTDFAQHLPKSSHVCPTPFPEQLLKRTVFFHITSKINSGIVFIPVTAGDRGKFSLPLTQFLSSPFWNLVNRPPPQRREHPSTISRSVNLYVTILKCRSLLIFIIFHWFYLVFLNRRI